MRDFSPIPLQRTLSVMPTYKCTAECAHCGTLSSPREKARLPLSSMLSAIEQAGAEGSYKAVVFTGGEPTLAGRDLVIAIQRAAALGLSVRIVTNAHWAVSDDAADRHMSEWVEAGLAELNLSTGDEHVRFVPLQNILRAARAAAKLGRTALVTVELVHDRHVTAELLEASPEWQAIRRDFPDSPLRVLESPWMPLDGQVRFRYPKGRPTEAQSLGARGGCESVLATTTLQADGSLGACCGIGMRLIPELQIGKIGETSLRDAVQGAEDDFLKRWLRVEGPDRILAWAAKQDPEKIEWEGAYAHRCQACIRLYQDPAVRRVIREKHQEKIADVLFAEWMLFHQPSTPEDTSAGEQHVAAVDPAEAAPP